MNDWPDIPGIRVGRLSEPTTEGACRVSEPTTASTDLTITIEEPDLASRLSTTTVRDVDKAWETLKRGNPRLFDGPMLSVLDYDAAAGRIRCARASYRFLAAAGWVQTGARMLGVNGVLTGEDADGKPWTLLARRGENTRVYPGMWEFAPAGGIDHGLSAAALDRAGSHGEARFGIDVVLAALCAEAEEELGIPLAQIARAMQAIALCEDAHAPSVDIIVRVNMGRVEPERPPRREQCWEYSQTRWVRVADLGGVEGLSLMGRGLARYFGWAKRGPSKV